MVRIRSINTRRRHISGNSRIKGISSHCCLDEIPVFALDRYIEVLENACVLFRLRGYSRNLRNEVGTMDMIIFHDVGVRNMVIGNLAEPGLRDDAGRLGENFLVAERRKLIEYRASFASSRFWRLRTGAELDYVEEEDGHLRGCEFKYGGRTSKAPASWAGTYPASSHAVVNRDAWQDFVLGGDLQAGVNRHGIRSYIAGAQFLTVAGLCLVALGRLRKALPRRA